MKGSISEFELGVLRARMLDAARAKGRAPPGNPCSIRDIEVIDDDLGRSARRA